VQQEKAGSLAIYGGSYGYEATQRPLALR